MAADLSSSCQSRLLEVFDTIDIDYSGTISIHELDEACRLLSVKLSDEDVKAFTKADSSGDGVLDYREFCEFMGQRLHSVFSSLDSDGSGDITVHELRTAFGSLGYQPTEREINALVAKVDTNRDGVVSFSEFCDYFSFLPSPNVRSIIEQWASGLSVDIGTDLAPPTLPPSSVPIWRALLAGGVAGMASRTLTAPLEKIKLLAQTSGPTQSVRIIPTLKQIVLKERWTGLFSGNATNCLRVIPFSGLVCVAYSNIAKYFPVDGTLTNGISRMMAGVCAGSFATILTHPMDVIRARLTVQSTTNGSASISGMFSTILRKEGTRGLYKGLTPTLAAIGPFIGVQQSSYDLLKHWFTSRGVEATPLLLLTCGGAAGVTAQTVVYPLDVIRRQLQVHSDYTSPTKVAKDLLINRRLFAGLSATYLKVMPSVAISLLVRDAVLGRLK